MITPYTKTNWIRVSKKQLCPICGKPDWCMISADGKSAICARIESPKSAGKAGWLHNWENGITPPPPVHKEKPSSRAVIEVLNTTYRRFLAELNLTPAHRESLHRRGVSDAQIAIFNFKSMPTNNRDQVVQTLLKNNVCLQGVPGFWRNTLNQYKLAGPHGITIPVMDIQGRICGLQIRCDDTANGKYKWLSSAERLNGSSPGTVVHVARPENYLTDEVWITEGPLKADIACLKLKRIVLAVPGVACWAEAVPVLCYLKIRKVVLALDMDKLTNKYVEVYLNQLKNRLLELNFAVYEASWNSNFKGLDDILVTGEIND